MIDTSQTLPLALIGLIDPGAVDSCKSNKGHWVEPQTADFYTADMYLILLSDHNDNFSKYNQNIVVDLFLMIKISSPKLNSAPFIYRLILTYDPSNMTINHLMFGGRIFKCLQ